MAQAAARDTIPTRVFARRKQKNNTANMVTRMHLARTKALPPPSSYNSYRITSANHVWLTQYTPLVVDANGSAPKADCPWTNARPDARCNHKSLLRAGIAAKRNASAAISTKKIASNAPGRGSGSGT
jgi:hypothetical protein